MRLNNEAFKIGILRHRQELGRVLNFKCLKQPPWLVDVVSCVGLDYLYFAAAFAMLATLSSPCSSLAMDYYAAAAAADSE